MSISPGEVVVVLFGLTAAIIGTISNSSRRNKAAIIALVSVASVVTLFVAERDARDMDTVLASLHFLSRPDPPELDSDALVQLMNPVLRESGQFISQQSVYANDDRIFLLRRNEDDSDPSGVMFLPRTQMKSLFYAQYEQIVRRGDTRYVQEYLDDSWTDCAEHRNDCFRELSAISRFALDYLGSRASESRFAISDELAFRWTAIADGRPIRIELDRTFIETLYGLRRDQRGAKIFDASQEQINTWREQVEGAGQ